jgi:hypothetical protein
MHEEWKCQDYPFHLPTKARPVHEGGNVWTKAANRDARGSGMLLQSRVAPVSVRPANSLQINLWGYQRR